MTDPDPEFAEDLLEGADAIAEFLFGDRKFRRKVYHLASKRLPVFTLGGSMLHARKSVLLKWVADQETRRVAEHESENTSSESSSKGTRS
jgi:hypothetical protein